MSRPQNKTAPAGKAKVTSYRPRTNAVHCKDKLLAIWAILQKNPICNNELTLEETVKNTTHLINTLRSSMVFTAEDLDFIDLIGSMYKSDPQAFSMFLNSQPHLCLAIDGDLIAKTLGVSHVVKITWTPRGVLSVERIGQAKPDNTNTAQNPSRVAHPKPRVDNPAIKLQRPSFRDICAVDCPPAPRCAPVQNTIHDTSEVRSDKPTLPRKRGGRKIREAKAKAAANARLQPAERSKIPPLPVEASLVLIASLRTPIASVIVTSASQTHLGYTSVEDKRKELLKESWTDE